MLQNIITEWKGFVDCISYTMYLQRCKSWLNWLKLELDICFVRKIEIIIIIKLIEQIYNIRTSTFVPGILATSRRKPRKVMMMALAASVSYIKESTFAIHELNVSFVQSDFVAKSLSVVDCFDWYQIFYYCYYYRRYMDDNWVLFYEYNAWTFNVL